MTGMLRPPARVFAVAETAPLHVQLIAKTEFVAPSDMPWSTDAGGGTTPETACWNSVANGVTAGLARCAAASR
ncbi:MAG: thymidylate synthase [Mycobacterium sp.]|nr:thymidylate synthase [Mycobacterium sp.]